MIISNKKEMLEVSNMKPIAQKEVDEALKEIAKSLRSLPNIGLNYMEYISALIYVIYENERKDIERILEIPNAMEEIDEAIERIRKNEKSDKLFSNIRFYKVFYGENEKNLKRVIHRLNELITELKIFEPNHKNKLAKGFEYLIMKAAQDDEIAFQNTEFYTPKGLVKTMVKLLDIKNNGAVYNPACGTGNFITESAEIADIYAFGEENNISNYNICLTNLWLHEVYNKRIKERDTEEFQLVDFAITNPPFVSDMDEDIQVNARLQDIYDHYHINKRTSSSYTKYLVKMVESVHQSGKVAIVVPHGFLFKKSDYILRRKLIEENYVEAIVGLPEKLFYHTKISVVILILNKAKREKEILFIDSSKEYESKRKTNILTVKNQDKILETYKKREKIEGYSYIARLDEIQKNDFNLNINKYVKAQDKIEDINQEEIEKNIYQLELEKEKIQEEIWNLVKLKFKF